MQDYVISETNVHQPEWEIGSTDVPSNWTDIIGSSAADPRDRCIVHRTGLVQGFHFDVTYGDPLQLQRRRIFVI